MSEHRKAVFIQLYMSFKVWKRKIVYKSLILDRNTCNHIIVWKQMIIIIKSE